MGDSIAEELVQLFRGINASLTVKLSHLLGFVFRNKNASSIGAAAGLAIALWWTWKCWRIPGARPHPRVDKRDGADAASASATRAPAGASMDSGPGALSTAVATSITQATQRGGPAEGRVSETDELSVAQIVRRQLNGSRKMTCQLLGVILEESSPEEVQKHAVVRPAVVEVLLEIARTCDLYLVARVVDDARDRKSVV